MRSDRLSSDPLNSEQLSPEQLSPEQLSPEQLSPEPRSPDRSLELSPAELKVLLKLLGEAGYAAPLERLKPSPKLPKRELRAIAQSLQSQGLIHCRSQIERFALTQRGRMLFRLEMAARPVTPDEWLVMQSCRKGAIAVEEIAAKVPRAARQDLLQNLVQRELIKVMGEGMTQVELTQAGQGFLRGYRPRGQQALLSLDLLTHYLNFMASPPFEPGVEHSRPSGAMQGLAR